MTSFMRSVMLPAALVFLVPTSAAVAVPKAGAKPTPACGARVLPLIEGNTWTYSAVTAPNPAEPEMARIIPRQPKQIVITVKSVEAKGTDTVVALEEKVSYEIIPESKDPKKPPTPTKTDVTVQSSIVCNKTKFEISPDSFFFSGEPGGYHELTFDKIERSRDTSFKLTNGAFGDAAWREDIVAKFTRHPTKESAAVMSGGKLELERSFTPETAETITMANGKQYSKAEKLALKTSGRVTLDTSATGQPAKPSELPADWVTKFWFAPDVGIVQTLNVRYAHMYQMTSFTTK